MWPTPLQWVDTLLLNNVRVLPFWPHGEKVVNLELIKKYDDYYLVRNEKGEEIKLYMLKQVELDRIRRENNIKVAENLDSKKLMHLSSMLETINKTELLIEHYEAAATRLVEHLNMCYDEVGRPNLFHHYIKNLDPEQYGRAQTFRIETRQLIETVHEIFDLKRGLG